MSAQKHNAAPASGSTLLPLTLAALVMVSALAVIQVKHRNRAFTTQENALRAERERLELEWTQLQLEEATLAQHSRVDQLARAQFEMIDPADYRIVESAPAAGGAQ